MRKILTQEEIALKEKKRNRILTIVMLLILVVSTAGYAFMSTDFSGSIDEGVGVGKIQNYGNQWVANFGGNQHVFSSSPESAFNNTILDFIPDISKYYAKPLYIDSKSDIISAEIGSNLGYYAERVNKACYGACNDTNLPEKDCSDNLIIYTSANENKITQEGNCTFIEGDIRAVDAFLYREIGIA